jgi:AbrB family transcriptional regulator (stage V sporulation protein T)
MKLPGITELTATGIIRRIDDVGRVIIPREILRAAGIKEDDPLEIFVTKDGEVFLKRYTPESEEANA